jgi:membrane-associated phospholipid phosphatase
MDPVLAVRGGPQAPVRPRLVSTIRTHFWFKCFGTIGFTATFFAAYFYLLQHPAFPVRIIPTTWLDRLIPFQPFALAFYVSLWLYVSLPPMLMLTRRQIVEYGFWMGLLCVTGLAAFFFWPSAVPPASAEWGAAPGMSILKGIDASGNACPSLHVATAVYAAVQLQRELPRAGFGRGANWLSAAWCVAIAYSTMATKQHVALDVLAGGALGLVFGLTALRIELPVLREQKGKT